MIQIVGKDTVKLTNSGVTITKYQYDELDNLMRNGWYYMALRFVQVALDAYKGMATTYNSSISALDTEVISLYSASHYNEIIQNQIQALVNASVYTTMRDAIADSIGFVNLSGIATLAWEMEYDMKNDAFYHDMLECTCWTE